MLSWTSRHGTAAALFAWALTAGNALADGNNSLGVSYNAVHPSGALIVSLVK